MKKNVNTAKNKVHDFWNQKSCGTEHTNKAKFTKKYFEEIEEYRYQVEPEILTFTQFTRYCGKKVLEVGIGAGTDFIQWIRAGAQAYGIDLTIEGIDNVKNRLKIYHLNARDIKVTDCEHLPYKDEIFDLVYSWGVIHHTPNTKKALSEIIRVTKPDGECKIMIYHRHSLVAYTLWIRYALLKGKPWKSLSYCVANYMESPGTKAYTKKEIEKTLQKYPIKDIEIKTILTVYDTLALHGGILHLIANFCAKVLGGSKVGWFMTIQFKKND